MFRFGVTSETMANNGNIALSVGVILLLVNVGVGASGVLDGVIEGSVEETVNDGYDGLDDDGNQDYTADFDDLSLIHI